MFLSPLQNALLFTINTLFSIYISIVLLRLMLQFIKVDSFNPIVKAIVKATKPLVSFWRADCTAFLIALGLQAINLSLALYIKGFTISPSISSISGLVLWSFGELIDLSLLILLFATFIQIIASWIQPNNYNPVLILAWQLTEPIFRPIRRIIPSIGGLDFTPMLVIFLIMLMRLLLADFFIAIGKSMI